MDQLILTLHVDAAHLAQHLVVIRIIHLNPHFYRTIGKVYVIQKGILYIRSRKPDAFLTHITDVAEFFHDFLYLGKDLTFQLMIHRKHFHPFRNEKPYLTHWKFIENFFQNAGDIFFFQLFAISRHSGDLILFLNVSGNCQRFFFIGHLGVHNDKKWLALFFQLRNRPFLCLQEIFSGNLSKASVCSDDKAYGRVLFDHLSRPHLCRLMKWDSLFKPGCFYHPFLSAFDVSCRILYQKSHTVDQAYLYLLVIAQNYRNRFLWNKLRFHRGDHFTGTA